VKMTGFAKSTNGFRCTAVGRSPAIPPSQPPTAWWD